MTTNIAIEDAKTVDAEEILALQKRAYQSEAEIYDDHEIPPLMQTLVALEEEFNNHLFLKASDSKGIVGSVRAYRDAATCHIERLIVDPAHQGKGLGKELMNAIEGRFTDVGLFELFTGHKSERNLHLYRRLGYVQVRSEKVNDGLTFVYLQKKSADSA